MRALSWPEGFRWGVSTSAYQIEGGVHLDERGTSIWDTFAAGGGTRDRSDGAVAADHRHLMRDDVELLAALGIPNYRFSVAWPRVQPEVKGPPSQAGLDFYRALVDELLDRHIEPHLTLYHWDLPQTLEDAGGWPARDTAERFADYAGIVAAALGDRVRHWTTINEPWCAAMLGYAGGIHAPGRTEPDAALAAAHHLLLAHGQAVDVIREILPTTAEVGITLNPYPVIPASDSPEDLAAARRIDGLANRLWYDAVLLGTYPDDVGIDPQLVRDGDLAQISRPLDSMGLNYYRRYHVRHSPHASAPPSEWPGVTDVAFAEPAFTPTSNGWAVEPEGLTEALVRLSTDYDPPPLYVHESGGAFHDEATPDGEIHDDDRIAYLDSHLRCAHAAISQGVDLRGFFVWSFLDNFEWAEGYGQRFGIVHVDFTTLCRTPKASAHWFRQVIADNGVPLPDDNTES